MDSSASVEVEVRELRLDEASGAAVLILEDGQGRLLPIAIGLSEATSIAKELEGLDLARPLTHDLLCAPVEELGGQIQQVEITSLIENTYHAELLLEHSGGRTSRVDSRPSDAVALAVRVKARIFVRESVFEATQSEPAGPPGSDPEVAEEAEPTEGPERPPLPTDKEGWRRLLIEMDPKDFGKYKL